LKPIKDFGEFLEDGFVIKKMPDHSRAMFLVRNSEKTFRFIHKIIELIGIDVDNASDVSKLCYDSIMELIRAKMLITGFSSESHEAEVSFLRTLKFREIVIQELDQLRYLRNGVTYYGREIDIDYTKKVICLIQDIHPKLKNMIVGKL